MKKLFFPAFLFCCFLAFGQKDVKTAAVDILYSPGHPANIFIPSLTLGAAYDGHEKGGNDLILQPDNIKAMLSSGFKQLSYRLRTELGNEAWHWNPDGSWSDAKNKRGYWVSSENTKGFISLSYGYRLPRRGNTFDQADNDGYSRIDDGNEKTFWKSDPYLDEYYADTKQETHPQWVVIDLGKEEYINAIRIKWAQPYASSFTIDFAVSSLYDYFIHSGYYETDNTGLWKQFANSFFIDQNGNDHLIRLSDSLTRARFIRIRMTAGSHTALKGSTDVRDSLGFSIKEIYIGRINNKGVFTDLIHHGTDNRKQSGIYVSSTDCWHRAIDINKNTEQAGIDRIYQSGLTNHMPALIPVGLLYDNPENAMALVNYLIKKNYLIQGIEMGEEADGQSVTPEDYAFLYCQWTKKIRQSYPALQSGGPSLEAIILNREDELFPTQTWLNRFFSYLSAHNSMNTFNFLSFECYPYDNICDSSAPQLAEASYWLREVLKDIHESTMPKNIPVYIAEYGYSAFSGRSEVAIEGALMNADIVGQFLTLGGNKAFLYGLEPNLLESNVNCSTFGNNMLFGRDSKGKIIYKTAAYYGATMLTQYWAQPADKLLEIYPATSGIFNLNDEQIISAYALLCPDSTWSLLLINKDPLKQWNVDLKLINQSNRLSSSLHFPVTVWQYSGKQYKWHENGMHGFPSPDLPPEKTVIKEKSVIVLPPYSLTVVRENKN